MNQQTSLNEMRGRSVKGEKIFRNGEIRRRKETNFCQQGRRRMTWVLYFIQNNKII